MDVLFDRLDIEKQSYVSNPDFMVDFRSTVRRTTDYLKKQIHKKPSSSQILIILDDVWEENFDGVSVLSAFDIGVPIMITTQVKSIMDDYDSYCSFIDCGKGLELEESNEMLSKYVKCSPNELPETAKDICIKCKGSPLMLSRIGATQAPYGNNEERWVSLNEKVSTNGVLPLRIRHSSGDLKAHLKSVVKCCLTLLDDLSKYFYDFVVFKEDVAIPSKVLEVFWNKDEKEVEDIMLELLDKSLIMKEGDSRNPGSFCYIIHDLYLEILKDDNKDQETFHRRLVDNYLNLCKTEDNKYDFGLLPNDDYIHHYIGYHSYEANAYKVLKDIYLDLNFVQKKIRISGPGDLLWDYYVYMNCFESDKAELRDFENFVRRNGTHVYEKNGDVIQLALFEPPTSAVYIKAKQIADSKPNKYFKWCNQEDNSPYSDNLNKKSSSWDVNHAVLSPDSTIVASVGIYVEIWSSSSGEELKILNGHTEVVNWCVFNSKGDRLATASADKTVKIFEVDPQLIIPRKSSKGKRSSLASINVEESSKKDSSIFTFDYHEGEVLCCSYSSDDLLLISSDNLGVIYVWELLPENKVIIRHRVQHENSFPANLCLFNHGSTAFATSSGDTIKLWNIKTGACELTVAHDDMFVSRFCFTPAHNYIFSCYNNMISKWDSNGNNRVFNHSKSFTLCSCCLSHDGNYFACGTSKYSVFVWNVNSWKIIANLKGHSSPVTQVMFSNDGTKLLSQSSDMHIIHDMTLVSNTSMISLEGILSVQYERELHIASLNYFNCIELRTGLKGELQCKTPQEDSDITACSLSSDCSEIAYGTKKGSVKVFNTISNKLFPCSGEHGGQVTYLIHKQDDLTYFTCSEDKKIKIWRNKKIVQTLQGHSKAVVMCIPFKSSKKLLSCSEDGTLRVWYIDSEDSPMILEGHGNQRVTFCDISPSEQFIASASSDFTVKLWNSENGTKLKTLECEDCVRCCRFSSNSVNLMLGTDSGNVMIWNLLTKRKENIARHDSWVNNIQYSSDGSQIVSVSDSVKLYDSAGHLSQTLSLPGTDKCVIWANANFEIFVLIHNSVLYILKKIH